MKYVEALDRLSPDRWQEKTLFLGGGITNCPDWQREVRLHLEDTDVTVLNPRREHFPTDDPSSSESQIVWEYEHMAIAKAIVFWFCSETVCPITLFEYGSWITRLKKPLFVGCHPEYSRLADIRIQTRLVRPYQIVHTDLGDLIKEVKAWSQK